MERKNSKKANTQKRRLGQYFTPPAIAEFMLNTALTLLPNHNCKSILDPACGDGVFLKTAVTMDKFKNTKLYGIDLDAKNIRRAKSIAAGINLKTADALTNQPFNELVQNPSSLVVGNPPFGGGGLRGRPELKFALRFAMLTSEVGAGAVILPHGFFANTSAQKTRDKFMELADPVAVVELPVNLFRTRGAVAKTYILFYRRAGHNSGCIMIPYLNYLSLTEHLSRASKIISTQRAREGAIKLPRKKLIGERMDTQYWCAPVDSILKAAKVELEPLGEHIEHISYGPIVTGSANKKSTRGRVRLIGLRELLATGVNLKTAKRVGANSKYVREGSKLKRGDILFARSGVGSLLKNRVALFNEELHSAVGSFVDLIRIKKGADSPPAGYVMFALKSGMVRAQIKRIANGVGTPNISFKEIRTLLIPRLSRAKEMMFAKCADELTRLHALALSGDSSNNFERADMYLKEAVQKLNSTTLNKTGQTTSREYLDA